MRLARLYVPENLAEGTSVRLDTERSHYLARVLRLKRGTGLAVFNGDGAEYAATVAETSRVGVLLTLTERLFNDVESPLRVLLGLGISRGERMDLAIQKAVELGVARIAPLLTEHCVVRLNETRRGSRLAHWQRIVQGACEQCGRSRVPEVLEPCTLYDWIGGQSGRNGLKLFFDPRASNTLGNLSRPESEMAILSGPEGGFAEWERRAVKDAGFVPVRLGRRILRTETAVLAALAAVQTLWGDFAGRPGSGVDTPGR